MQRQDQNQGKRILLVYGTRPEWIKIASVVKKAKNRGHHVSVVKVLQHTDLISDCPSDHQVAISVTNDNRLNSIVASILACDFNMKGYDFVVVQGDTSTALGFALKAFHAKIPVVHVEAGMRSGNIMSPFPEEANRRLISTIASYHFCPTSIEAENLWSEGVKTGVFVSGNTVLDSLKDVAASAYRNNVLITMHRRENADRMREWFAEIEKLSATDVGARWVFPAHPTSYVFDNTDVFKYVDVMKPKSYDEFIAALRESKLVVTDSGGVQEEAAFLGIPCIVCRNETERVQGITQGFATLCTTPSDLQVHFDYWRDKEFAVPNVPCPYGDGNASKMILDILEGESESENGE